ncbi:UNVERIFIED_CONTAM: Serine carboxypeptidase-like 18, partial [Sesamum angustifolium]
SANILFIDQPADIGYSYSNTLKGYISNDTLSTRLCYDFLKKWLIKHPQYLKNPLFIVGESYSGITLPLIVNEVYKGLEAGDKPMLNMKVQLQKTQYFVVLSNRTNHMTIVLGALR